MQYLYIAITVLTLFTDYFKGLFRSREMKLLAVGVVLYVIYSNLKNKEKKSELEGNMANSDEGKLAVKLFQAIQPIMQFKIPLLGYTPVYASKKDVADLAYTIGQKGLYQKVAEAYKLLYEIDLSKHLEQNFAFDTFTEAHDNGRGKVGGYTNGKGIFIREGKRYRAYENWRLRETTSPYKAVGQTEPGEVYEVQTIFQAPINGTTALVAIVKIVKGGLTMPFWERVIAIDAFYAAG